MSALFREDPRSLLTRGKIERHIPARPSRCSAHVALQTCDRPRILRVDRWRHPPHFGPIVADASQVSTIWCRIHVVREDDLIVALRYRENHGIVHGHTVVDQRSRPARSSATRPRSGRSVRSLGEGSRLPLRTSWTTQPRSARATDGMRAPSRMPNLSR